MNESFFVVPQAEPCAILLIDASYSVLSKSNYETSSPDATIFDEMLKISLALPHKKFRVLFWNSSNQENTFGIAANGSGIRGVSKFPEEIEKEKLPQTFKLTSQKIKTCSVTEPHLGFCNIDDWLRAGFSQTIYFFTDGFIGWNRIQPYESQTLNRQLSDSIRRIVNAYPRVQINIIAVEGRPMDLSVEQSEMIGNDVVAGISRNNMTGALTSYLSYAPNKTNGYVHINKVQTVPGFVPFGSRHFSILSTHFFMQYLADLIESKKTDEDALLRIIQDLTVTLNVLTKERPQKVREQTFNLFLHMFNDTVVDKSIAKFILSQGLAAEACGSAQLYADYRSNLKNLYADANRLLVNNAASALGINRDSLTLPLKAGSNRIIVVSSSTTANETVLNHKNGGYLCSGKLIPIVPFVSLQAPLITKQCLRQWLRALIAKEYHLNATGDEIIFVAMGINLQVQLALLNDVSPLAKKIREAYINLITVLLEKKRLNSQSTEMDALLAGNIFVPNDGNLQMFPNYLKRLQTSIGLAENIDSLLLWYALCAAHSPELAKSQWRHCQQHLGQRLTLQDFSDWAPKNISVYEIPEELEYECFVTLDSTEKVGGMRFKPHQVPILRNGKIIFNDCCPKYVTSRQGFERIFENKETTQCPICYANITKDQFEAVGPRGEVQCRELESLETNQIFGAQRAVASVAAPSPANATSSTFSSSSSASSVGTPGRLIVLIGVVGCGKTTLAKAIKEIADRENRHCVIEGTDKYCMQGLSMQSAISTVATAIRNLVNSSTKDKTLILDVCNERFDARDVFGVDLSSWKIEKIEVNLDRSMIPQYLDWSLRNVLQRGEDDSYLNPSRSGLAICIKVHGRKAKSFFGAQAGTLMQENTPKEKALARVQSGAEAYQKMLDANKQKFAAKF